MESRQIGFGCFFPGKEKEEVAKILRVAIESGYRYFDTASFYETERALGEAIRQSGVDRRDLFLATKLWIDEKGYQNTKDAFYRSLERLGTDYLDGYLIHWPMACLDDPHCKEVNEETFRAMEDLQKEGVLKNAGLSNFLPHHLRPLLKKGFAPVMNQLELHPGYMQEEAVRFSKENGLCVQAWSPLGRGAVLQNEFLLGLSKKYGKTVSQICLIYLLQRGIMPIVKASGKERMLENLKVFDLELEKDDVYRISCMPQVGWSGEHPDFVIPKLKSNFEQ